MPAENNHRLDIPTWPLESEAVRVALATVYENGDWGRYSGEMSEQLCDRLSQRFAAQQVTLTSSGTIAVELALRGLGVGPDDEVILSAYDFPGNFRAIEAIGARPVLVDVVQGRWVLNASQLGSAVTEKTAAVICSHLHGDICPIQEVFAAVDRENIAVLEDVCQAPGALANGFTLGTQADAAVLSFGGSKLLTAGRGGAVLSNDAQVHQRIKVFGERGNLAFPMSELQAAVVCPQLDVLDEQNEKRLVAAERLIARLDALPWTSVPVTQDRHVFYKLAWMLDPSVDRGQFLHVCAELGIPLFEGFRGFVSRSDRRCSKPTPLTQAERAVASTVLLHHPILLADGTTLDQLYELIELAFKKCES